MAASVAPTTTRTPKTCAATTETEVTATEIHSKAISNNSNSQNTTLKSQELCRSCGKNSEDLYDLYQQQQQNTMPTSTTTTKTGDVSSSPFTTSSTTCYAGKLSANSSSSHHHHNTTTNNSCLASAAAQPSISSSVSSSTTSTSSSNTMTFDSLAATAKATAKGQSNMENILQEMQIWHLQIKCNDGLPQRICAKCIAQFYMIHKFRRKCLKVQSQLRSLYEEQLQRTQRKPAPNRTVEKDVEEVLKSQDNCDVIVVNDDDLQDPATLKTNSKQSFTNKEEQEESQTASAKNADEPSAENDVSIEIVEPNNETSVPSKSLANDEQTIEIMDLTTDAAEEISSKASTLRGQQSSIETSNAKPIETKNSTNSNDRNKSCSSDETSNDKETTSFTRNLSESSPTKLSANDEVRLNHKTRRRTKRNELLKRSRSNPESESSSQSLLTKAALKSYSPNASQHRRAKQILENALNKNQGKADGNNNNKEQNLSDEPEEEEREEDDENNSTSQRSKRVNRLPRKEISTCDKNLRERNEKSHEILTRLRQKYSSRKENKRRGVLAEKTTMECALFDSQQSENYSSSQNDRRKSSRLAVRRKSENGAQRIPSKLVKLEMSPKKLTSFGDVALRSCEKLPKENIFTLASSHFPTSITGSASSSSFGASKNIPQIFSPDNRNANDMKWRRRRSQRSSSTSSTSSLTSSSSALTSSSSSSEDDDDGDFEDYYKPNCFYGPLRNFNSLEGINLWKTKAEMKENSNDGQNIFRKSANTMISPSHTIEDSTSSSFISRDGNAHEGEVNVNGGRDKSYDDGNGDQNKENSLPKENGEANADSQNSEAESERSNCCKEFNKPTNNDDDGDEVLVNKQKPTISTATNADEATTTLTPLVNNHQENKAQDNRSVSNSGSRGMKLILQRRSSTRFACLRSEDMLANNNEVEEQEEVAAESEEEQQTRKRKMIEEPNISPCNEEATEKEEEPVVTHKRCKLNVDHDQQHVNEMESKLPENSLAEEENHKTDESEMISHHHQKDEKEDIQHKLPSSSDLGLISDVENKKDIDGRQEKEITIGGFTEQQKLVIRVPLAALTQEFKRLHLTKDKNKLEQQNASPQLCDDGNKENTVQNKSEAEEMTNAEDKQQENASEVRHSEMEEMAPNGKLLEKRDPDIEMAPNGKKSEERDSEIKVAPNGKQLEKRDHNIEMSENGKKLESKDSVLEVAPNGKQLEERDSEMKVAPNHKKFEQNDPEKQKPIDRNPLNMRDSEMEMAPNHKQIEENYSAMEMVPKRNLSTREDSEMEVAPNHRQLGENDSEKEMATNRNLLDTRVSEMEEQTSDMKTSTKHGKNEQSELPKLNGEAFNLRTINSSTQNETTADSQKEDQLTSINSLGKEINGRTTKEHHNSFGNHVASGKSHEEGSTSHSPNSNEEHGECGPLTGPAVSQNDEIFTDLGPQMPITDKGPQNKPLENNPKAENNPHPACHSNLCSPTMRETFETQETTNNGNISPQESTDITHPNQEATVPDTSANDSSLDISALHPDILDLVKESEVVTGVDANPQAFCGASSKINDFINDFQNNCINSPDPQQGAEASNHHMENLPTIAVTAAASHNPNLSAEIRDVENTLNGILSEMHDRDMNTPRRGETEDFFGHASLYSPMTNDAPATPAHSLYAESPQTANSNPSLMLSPYMGSNADYNAMTPQSNHSSTMSSGGGASSCVTNGSQRGGDASDQYAAYSDCFTEESNTQSELIGFQNDIPCFENIPVVIANNPEEGEIFTPLPNKPEFSNKDLLDSLDKVVAKNLGEFPAEHLEPSIDTRSAALAGHLHEIVAVEGNNEIPQESQDSVEPQAIQQEIQYVHNEDLSNQEGQYLMETTGTNEENQPQYEITTEESQDQYPPEGNQVQFITEEEDQQNNSEATQVQYETVDLTSVHMEQPATETKLEECNTGAPEEPQLSQPQFVLANTPHGPIFISTPQETSANNNQTVQYVALDNSSTTTNWSQAHHTSTQTAAAQPTYYVNASGEIYLSNSTFNALVVAPQASQSPALECNEAQEQIYVDPAQQQQQHQAIHMEANENPQPTSQYIMVVNSHHHQQYINATNSSSTATALLLHNNSTNNHNNYVNTTAASQQELVNQVSSGMTSFSIPTSIPGQHVTVSIPSEPALEQHHIQQTPAATTNTTTTTSNDARKKDSLPPQKSSSQQQKPIQPRTFPQKVQKINLICRFCHKRPKFTNNVDYSNHIITMHPAEKPYNCDYCPKHFQRRSERQDHVAQVHGSRYQCAQCGVSFCAQRALDFHLQKFHASSVTCAIPPRIATVAPTQQLNSSSMASSAAQLTSSQHHQQQQNSTSYSSSSSLVKNPAAAVITHHTSDEDETKINKNNNNKCSDIINEITVALKQQHFQTPPRKLCCPDCNTDDDSCCSSKSSASQQTNHKECYGQQQQRVNPHCDKMNYHQSHYNMHAAEQNESGGLRQFRKSPIKCSAGNNCSSSANSNCMVSYNSNNGGGGCNYNNHSNNIQQFEASVASSDTASSYTCQLCEDKFATAPALRKHRTLVHNIQSSMAYTCNICNRGFRLRNALQRHMETHDAHGRPFECNICQIRFPRPSQLTLHRLTVHKFEKLHTCRECKRQFATESALKAHEKVAHEANFMPLPFACVYLEAPKAQKAKMGNN
ncbi:molting defective [Musca autumnalis]|uniref:molting defective n=1 Tax=Musca autumnalis TaxID=221902 RepID=UPI003CEF9F8A